jgi:cytochrome c oxidase subunit II
MWTLSRSEFPTGVPVEFDVTAGDVNHGFGLYDPQGHLIAQTQAMPGYTNRLIFTLEEPGIYVIRCLELCGAPHFLMDSQITVAD